MQSSPMQSSPEQSSPEHYVPKQWRPPRGRWQKPHWPSLATPKQVKDAFYSQDPEKNLDRIFGRLIPESPAVKQAEAAISASAA